MPGECHRQKRLWGPKESDMTERLTLSLSEKGKMRKHLGVLSAEAEVLVL